MICVIIFVTQYHINYASCAECVKTFQLSHFCMFFLIYIGFEFLLRKSNFDYMTQKFVLVSIAV